MSIPKPSRDRSIVKHSLGVSQIAARHREGVVKMGYSRAHVKEALQAARRDGKPLEALMVGDRETEITLERMGYLPIDQDAVDKRIQDWYVSQGLVLRADTPVDTPKDTPEPKSESPKLPAGASTVALEAAEAALAAATAAMRLARSMAS